MLDTYLHAGISWLSTHAELSTFFVFIIVFLETFAVVGVFIPGAAIMPAIGALIGTGVIPFYPTLIATFIAGCLGDNISYALGRCFHQRLHTFWPFCRHPHWLANAQRFMQCHGRKSIFWGRFVGPLRAMLPLIAGMMDMRWRRFLAADTASSLVWTIFYLMPGVALGILAPFLPISWQNHPVMLGIGLILVLWICSMIPLYCIKRVKQQKANGGCALG